MALQFAFAMIGCAFVVGIWKPPVLFGVGIVLFSFEQWAQANAPFFVHHQMFINFSFGVLTLLVCFRALLAGRSPFDPISTGHWLTFGFYIYLAASITWSINPMQSFMIVWGHSPYVLTVVILTPLLIKDKDDMITALISVLAIGSVVMLLLLVGTRIHDWGRTIQAVEKVLDRRGELTNRLSPLTIAEMGAQIAFVAVLFNFMGLQKIWSPVRWIIVLMAYFLIIRSGSRGQLMAAFVSTAMFFGVSRAQSAAGHLLRLAIGLIVMFGVTFAAFQLLGEIQFAKRWEVDFMAEDFSETRVKESLDLLSYWLTSSPIRWLFGIGASASYDEGVLGGYCHVIPVEILAELGFVGLFWYFAILYQAVRSWLRLLRIHSEDRVNRGIIAVLGAFFVFGFLLTLKQGTMLSHISFMSGILLTFRYEAISQREVNREKAMKAYYWWWRSQMNQPQPASIINPA